MDTVKSLEAITGSPVHWRSTGVHWCAQQLSICWDTCGRHENQPRVDDPVPLNDGQPYLYNHSGQILSIVWGVRGRQSKQTTGVRLNVEGSSVTSQITCFSTESWASFKSITIRECELLGICIEAAEVWCLVMEFWRAVNGPLCSGGSLDTA